MLLFTIARCLKYWQELPQHSVGREVVIDS